MSSFGKLFSKDSVIVCIDDSIHNFYINGSAGSNYNWEIESSNNTSYLISGNGTDEIIVKFNSIGFFKLIGVWKISSPFKLPITINLPAW